MTDTAITRLEAPAVWRLEGRRTARWAPRSRWLLGQTRQRLVSLLDKKIPRVCTHIRGHGGVKGAIRQVQAALGKAHFAARFDIASYYESMSHRVLLAQLQQAGAADRDHAVVADYLRLPDSRQTGHGMVAGGSLSTLLAALYLVPLDRAMISLQKRGVLVCYIRYMDDVILLAQTRWHLRRAIAMLHTVLGPLGLRVHTTKRFIGKTTTGFDFLGYRLHRGRRLRASSESLRRLRTRARRLYERGADADRLRLYVARWHSWLHGGLRGLVSRQGGYPRLIRHIMAVLRAGRATPPPR